MFLIFTFLILPILKLKKSKGPVPHLNLYILVYMYIATTFSDHVAVEAYIYSVIVIAYKLYLQHLILSRYDKAISTKVTTAYGFVYRQHSY